MTKDAKTTDRVFLFKITLDDSSPKIWRRIVAPADYSFFDLHCAVQNAMGWCDFHLHAFDIAQKGTASPIQIRFPDPENDGQFGDDFLDERVERIADYFGKKVKQCRYCYDFGDNWDHTILFEREMPAEPGADYPQCTAGANACPPDDCGKDFDPTAFDADEVEFENPRQRLKEYERGFGVKPLRR